MSPSESCRENLAEQLVASLIKKLSDLGFKYVDIYAPGDEVVAITVSRSKEYIEEIQTVEVHQRETEVETNGGESKTGN